MKKMLILLLGMLGCLYLFGQQNPGIGNSNYAGIQGRGYANIRDITSNLAQNTFAYFQS